jgi:hypothetical protein
MTTVRPVGEDTAEEATDGLLKRPLPGVLPPRGGHPKMPATAKRRSKWVKVRNALHAHPGVPHKIAQFKKGGRVETARLNLAAQRSFQTWLRRNYPLEKWDIRRRTIPNTWYQRELWAVYHGEMTESEAVEWRKERMSKLNFGERGTAARRQNHALSWDDEET